MHIYPHPIRGSILWPLIAVLLLAVWIPQTFAITPAMAQPSQGPRDAREVEAFLDELIPSQLRENHIAGAAVAVVKDGQLLFARGYGYADLESKRPVIDQTLFRTDSTGKLFVWTAVMQLLERGKLDLDADVNTYLDFTIPATFPQPITLKHLMSHTAGFDGQAYVFAQRSSDVEPIGTWLAHNLPERVRPPGIMSSYSNYGTGLAAYIVERVAGMPFERYAEAYIFTPLGMQHSTFRQPLPAAFAADLTTTYRYANGAFQVMPFQYLRAQMGEGEMTVTDMAKFMIAHLQPDDSPILKAATARQMHSQLFTHDPRVSGFAHGFAETIQNGQRILRHEGNNQGVSSSALFLIPEHQIGVYVAYNSNGGFSPGESFRRAFLDHYFPVTATPPVAAALTKEQAGELAGSYRPTNIFARSFAKVLTVFDSLYGDVRVIANADGTFTTRGIGAEPLQWAAVEPQVLRQADGALNSYGDLVFKADEQDRITRLYVANNPYRAYEKVAWYQAIDVQRTWLALCALLFLSLLITVPLAGLLRWISPTGRGAAPNLGQWLLAGACLLGLVFLLGLALTLEEALLYGVTPALIGVLAVPILAIVLAVASVFFARKGWSAMGMLARLHYAAVMFAMVAYGWWLNEWNLLGFRF